MTKLSGIGLASLFAILVLCPIKSAAQESNEYVVTVGNEQFCFFARPELGYVVKVQERQGAISAMSDTLRLFGAKDIKPVRGLGQQGIWVVNALRQVSANEQTIAILRDQPATEYIAPLFEVDGEVVAVIPEIVVRLKNEGDIAHLQNLCDEKKCHIIRSVLYSKLEYLVDPAAKSGGEVLTIVDELNRMDFIEWATPDFALEPKLCGSPGLDDPNRVEPNDEYFHNQWHLDIIHAPEAWTFNKGDPNIVVAVIVLQRHKGSRI